MKSVYTGGEKVAEFESYDELRVGENKPAFIYEGNELVYPSPVKDGLVLWYDFSGRTNADSQRGIAEDLSGNGNHGTLQNFNYTAESGYDKNKLLFDGVDDFLQVPETGLNPESMAVVDGGKIYSYEGEVAKSIDSIGNILNSNKNLMTADYIHSYQGNSTKVVDGWYVVNTGLYGGIGFSTAHLVDGEPYVISWEYKTTDANGHWTISTPKNTVNPVKYGSNKVFETVKDGNIHKQIMYITATATEEISVSLLRSVDKGTIYYRNLKVERGTQVTPYNPSPEYIANRTKINELYSPMRNLLLYNRPLTPEEIAHNYAIEKERFGIE